MTVLAQIQNSLTDWKDKVEDKVASPLVSHVYERSMRAKLFHQRAFDRAIENWHIYLGLDAEYGLGQWPQEAVRFMLSKRRHVFTYNLAKITVERIAASLIQVPNDPEFFPVDNSANSLTERLKDIMYCDKERCGWNDSRLQLVIAGLVYQGVLRIDIDDEWDPLGNIAFPICLPNSWYADPMWKTNRTKDLKICWHEQFLTPDVLYEKWGDRNPRFKLDLESYMRGDGSFGVPTGAVPFDVTGDTWGSAQRVIHEYRMVRRPTKYEFVITAQGDVRIPKELEYPDEKIQWLNQRLGEGGWEPDQVYEKDDFDNICIKTTICPGISPREILDQAECEVQVGHPPFEVYSYDRVNGEAYGLIDGIKDMQYNINYSMSMKQFKLQMEGFGSAKGIDMDGFASEDEAERALLHWNDAGEAPYKLSAAYALQGKKPIVALAEPSIASNEAMNDLIHIIDRMWPLVSGNVPAMTGRAESGKPDSGVLHNSKVNQAEMGLFVAETRLRNFDHELYEDWLVQAAQQYSLGGIPRDFHRYGNEQSVRVNEPVTLPDGSRGIKNDMSTLKELRCQVIISEKQDTPTKKATDLTVLGDLLKTRASTQAGTPSVVLLLNTVTAKIDQLSAADKQKLEEVGDLEFQASMNDLKIKIMQQNQQLNPPSVPPQGSIPGGGGQAAEPGPTPQHVVPQQVTKVPQQPQAGETPNIPAPQGPNPMPPQATGGQNG